MVKKIPSLRKIVFLSLFITVLVLRGFLFNNLFIGHSIDWSVPSTDDLIKKHLISLLYSWGNSDLGTQEVLNINLFPPQSFFYFFSFLGFSNALVSRLMLFTTIFLSIVFFYLFLKYFLSLYKTKLGLGKEEKVSEIVILVSALVYALSPFLFHEIIFGSNVQFLTFTLIPLCLYLYLHYLKEDKLPYLILTVLVSLLLTASAQNLVFTNLFLLFFSLVDKKLKNYFLFLGIYLVVASFWILPFIVQFASFSKWALSTNPLGDVIYLKINPPNIFKSIFGYEYFFNRNDYLATMPSWFFYIWLFNKFIFFILPFFTGVLFMRKKIKGLLIYFLMAIFLIDIFFVKGANLPLGEIIFFLYRNIPLFNLFRSQQHYQVVYTFLTALFFALSWIWILSLKKDKTYKKLILLIIFFGLVIYSLPWLVTGDIGIKSLKAKNKDHIGLYQLSPGYRKLYQFMSEEKTDFRLLNLPMAHSPFYLQTEYQDMNQGGNIDNRLLRPTLTADVSSGNSAELANLLHKDFTFQLNKDVLPSLFGFLNFKFLALKSDVLPFFVNYSRDYAPSKVKDYANELDFLTPLFDKDYVALYEVSDEYFLPHFYIPQNIIYSMGKIEDWADVVSFTDYPIRSGIYLDRNEQVLNMTNDIFVKGELESKANEEKSGKETSGIVATDVEDVPFPYVRWQPGGLVHALVLKKEQFDEWRVRRDPQKPLDKKLFYASKRISEIEKWGRKMDLDKAFERYKNKMEEALELLKEDTWQDKRILQQNILKTEVFLEAHKGKIITKKFDEEKKEKIQAIFEELKEEIKDLELKPGNAELIYNFEIPKDRNYQLLIKNEEFSSYLKDNQLELEAFREEITIPLLSGNEKWLAGGGFKLEKGKQRLILTKPQTINLLSEGDWLNNLAQSSFVKDKLITSAHLQLAFPGKSTVYFKPIENYQGNTSYKISFDYFSFDGETGITLIEDVGIVKRILLLSEKLSGTDVDSPRHAEKVFKSAPGAKAAEFYFWAKTEQLENSNIKFFNVKIERVFEPTIILHTIQDQKPLQAPTITFMKINPTKYRLKVEGAKEPYTLIFSESFHEGWKAWVADNTDGDTDNAKYGAMVASYFNGEIKEGTHKDEFLSRNTFETLGKKPIPEERHLLVNGYANSWYITPEDANGAENYEIVIEFWPQRFLYIGLGISLVALLSCLGYLGFDSFKNKKR